MKENLLQHQMPAYHKMLTNLQNLKNGIQWYLPTNEQVLQY